MIYIVCYLWLSITLAFRFSGLKDWADVKSKPLLLAGWTMGFIAAPLLLYGGCLVLMMRR